MIPKIKTIQEKKMMGMRLEMSLVENKTGDLFIKFMPHRKEIKNIISDGTYALQQYDFNSFTPQTRFEKWACVEVSSFDTVPHEMETRLLEAGKYAVFIHKGTVVDFIKSFRYMLEIWIPEHGYQADSNRPHFEYLTEKYLGPNNPNSEEEVWIPIK